ncbi:hypothetical protein IE4771_PB00068 (plasmid) [Rhizobium etli bv. mimosae str. IE4771]|uniref:Uncharacterized protein n=1 Tax=Rhizobium etli bv. mimosae str. IE4771 TaxID=1432050 RepID=A0A060I3S1_RHIET|nr:hypothetical protein IE4771_PB00068 [Rhizobium sp. IE4771]
MGTEHRLTFGSAGLSMSLIRTPGTASPLSALASRFARPKIRLSFGFLIRFLDPFRPDRDAHAARPRNEAAFGGLFACRVSRAETRAGA